MYAVTSESNDHADGIITLHPQRSCFRISHKTYHQQGTALMTEVLELVLTKCVDM